MSAFCLFCYEGVPTFGRLFVSPPLLVVVVLLLPLLFCLSLHLSFLNIILLALFTIPTSSYSLSSFFPFLFPFPFPRPFPSFPPSSPSFLSIHLTGISFGLECSPLAILTVSTPSSNCASTCSFSAASGTRKERDTLP